MSIDPSLDHGSISVALFLWLYFLSGSISAGQVTLVKLLSVSGLQVLDLQNEAPKPSRLMNHGRHTTSLALFLAGTTNQSWHSFLPALLF